MEGLNHVSGFQKRLRRRERLKEFPRTCHLIKMGYWASWQNMRWGGWGGTAALTNRRRIKARASSFSSSWQMIIKCFQNLELELILSNLQSLSMWHPCFLLFIYKKYPLLQGLLLMLSLTWLFPVVWITARAALWLGISTTLLGPRAAKISFAQTCGEGGSLQIIVMRRAFAFLFCNKPKAWKRKAKGNLD